jgi:hypothetical protein
MVVMADLLKTNRKKNSEIIKKIEPKPVGKQEGTIIIKKGTPKDE